MTAMLGATANQSLQADGLHWPLVAAMPHWQVVDFISDLHLHAGEPANFQAWQLYMEHTAAQAVFILGDLFDLWVGDDVLGTSAIDAGATRGSFEQQCVRVLQRAAARRAVFFMRGNRDFLVGEPFAGACGMQLLHDPTVLNFSGQRWLLSHGDALCLDDTDYMQFRALVRSAAWQQDFLGQPLPQRRAVASDLRARSEARKKSASSLGDLDTQAVIDWLDTANASVLIHGHTHRPWNHALAGNKQRWVLSDWDARATPPRAQVLRITAGTPARMQRLSAARA